MADGERSTILSASRRCNVCMTVFKDSVGPDAGKFCMATSSGTRFTIVVRDVFVERPNWNVFLIPLLRQVSFAESRLSSCHNPPIGSDAAALSTVQLLDFVSTRSKMSHLKIDARRWSSSWTRMRGAVNCTSHRKSLPNSTSIYIYRALARINNIETVVAQVRSSKFVYVEHSHIFSNILDGIGVNFDSLTTFFQAQLDCSDGRDYQTWTPVRGPLQCNRGRAVQLWTSG